MIFTIDYLNVSSHPFVVVVVCAPWGVQIIRYPSSLWMLVLLLDRVIGITLIRNTGMGASFYVVFLLNDLLRIVFF